jgi:hypothetical protein
MFSKVKQKETVMANCNDTRVPMSRERVFEALGSEREYQKRRWGIRQNNGQMFETQHGVCDYLTYMGHYLTKAKAEASEKAGNDAALEMLRKVVTLGIACFEQNGIQARDLSKPIINGRDGQSA